MRVLGFITVCLLLFSPVMAPAQEEDKGFLEGTLEDALSGPGRVVRVTGFEGALSSEASLEEMTISDDEGIWLTLRDVELVWARTALLRGRLEVEKLKAAEILLPRLPVPAESTGPSPEASGFSLPELPVSVNIGELSADRISIGKPVFGLAADLSLAGSLKLEDGEGTASLNAERLDEAQGTFSLDAGFTNETRQLSLSLLVDEEAGGIFATLIGLPGQPSVRLSAIGDAPLSDFAASLELATDGQERLTGSVSIADTEIDTGTGQSFSANLSGDLTPLFQPEYRAFFGDDTALRLTGVRSQEGGLDIRNFDLASRTLSLQGQLRLAPGGLPERIAVTGQIADPDGAPVLLPLSGEPTRLAAMSLEVSFDASRAENWTAIAEIRDLERTGFRAESIALDGSGRIGTRDGGQSFVTSAFDFRARDLDLGSAAAAEALGETVTGRAEVDWQAGQPVQVRRLDVTGETYSARASGTLSVAGGDLGVTVEARVSADDLSAFSGLAQRPLSGAAQAEVSAAGDLLSGRIGIVGEAEIQDLRIGIRQADALLAGKGRLDIAARRDETGTFLDRFEVATDAARIDATAALKSSGSTARLSAWMRDSEALLPGLNGQTEFEARAREENGLWAVDASVDGEALKAATNGIVDLTKPVGEYRGDVSLSAPDLSAFADLAGRPLEGAVAISANGRVTFDLEKAEVTAQVRTTNLATGIPQADSLTSGAGQLEITARRDGEYVFVDALDLKADGVVAEGRGAYQPGRSNFDLSAEVFEARRLLPGFVGPMQIAARVRETRGVWDTQATVEGSSLNVEINGDIDLTTDIPRYRGKASLASDDLSIFSGLARRPLGGTIDAEAEGVLGFDLGVLDLAASATTQDIRTGLPEADRILAGTSTLTFDAARNGTDIAIRRIAFASPLLTVNANGKVSGDERTIGFSASLADIGPFVPDLTGALNARGTAVLSAGTWTVEVLADGPGGSIASVAGGVAEDVSSVDLEIRGRAPLALANRALNPRAVGGSAVFDLRLKGAPGIGAISGRVSTQDARFVDPGSPVSLEAMRADIAIAGGQATIDMTSNARTGGRISVQGPLALSAPFNADLDVIFERVVVRDPSLYETSVSGTVSVEGPLTGGAQIAGRLGLGTTEVRIPSSTAGGVSDIPEIRHIGEPAAVRETRGRAGLLAKKTDAGGGGGPVYGLDIFIAADNQIFIRGRGLDAELGGRLRVRGTTADVIPDGQFELIRGRMDIFGRRLVLSEGNVTLRGDFDAFVQLEAVTDVEDVTIRVVIEGPITDPTIRFLSNPTLPDDEVVARLLFGKGIDTLSPIQAAQLAASVRTLSGAGGPGLLGSIRERTGLADLDVTTSEEGAAQVRAGRYLSEDVYSDVTVDSTGQTELNLNFDISPRVTLKGSVTSEGETGFGLFFERDY